MAAPCTFTPERASEVICRLSSGRPLAAVCRDPDMPTPETVLRWARKDPAFAAGLQAVRVRPPWSPGFAGRRQSAYSPALARGVCAALAEGFSLREVCASPAVGLHPNTVMHWARTRADFGPMYAEATQPRPGTEGTLRIGRGRHGAYTPERAAAVVERLLQGRSLGDICRDPDMPSESVIKQWRRRHMDFHLALQAARRFQLDLLMDEILAAAEDGFTAGKARLIVAGLAARGVRAMGAGEAGALVEDAGPAAEAMPVRVRKARRVGAPGIGHNWRGR